MRGTGKPSITGFTNSPRNRLTCNEDKQRNILPHADDPFEGGARTFDGPVSSPIDESNQLPYREVSDGRRNST
jgi:hypothetical protein